MTRLAFLSLIIALHMGCSAPAETSEDIGATGAELQGRTTDTPAVKYEHVAAYGRSYHVTTIDLTRPEVSIRATKHAERGRTTSSFAAHTGAAVAVNGDWFSFSNSMPRGLAVGDGEHWPGTRDLVDHAFIACFGNVCSIEEGVQASGLYFLWNNVVGGNESRLIRNGEVRPAAHDNHATYTANTPRTAVGLTRDKNTMFLLVADQDNVGGTRWRNIALFLEGLGAYNAISLDGGGSSTMVVDGRRVNRIKAGQGSERRVSNHLGILIDKNKIPFNGAFSDDDGHRFEREINNIAAAGITEGCQTGPRPRFCPDSALTRGEMAAFLVRAFNLPASNHNYFSDDDNKWYRNVTNALAAAGITRGCGGGKYCGENKVTRGMMATFLARALDLPRATTNHFTDIPADSYYTEPANQLLAAGITTGCATNKFCGERLVTRAETAAFLSRALAL